MANLIYSRGQYDLGMGLLTTGAALRVMLVTTGYTASMDHNLVDDGTTNDPASYEIGVSGYARQSVAGLAWTEDDTNDCAYLDATDTTWGNLTAGATIGAAIIYRYSTAGGTTSDTGQDLVSYYSLTATPTNGGALTLTYSTAGILEVGTTS